jgi:carbonic anhydrase/acetyltransferase-like protein (isoleucine patch superfamily)
MLYPLGGKAPIIDPLAFVAPSADVIGDVVVGEGSSVWFGAVVRGDFRPVRIGRFSSVQDNCTVHPDPSYPITIGDYVTVGHGAVLHGCTIKDGALIGMGAVVLNGAVVEEGAVVGAGAVVGEGKVIPARSLAVGVPAKVIREIPPEEADRRRAWAAGYAALAENHYRGRF